MEDLQNLGYQSRDVVMKSDQEPAVRAVVEAVTAMRKTVSTTPECSPVGESPANAAVESAIFRVQGQMRTMKADLESKLGQKIQREGSLFK